MNGSHQVLELEPTTSEIIEMFYQISFFLIGTPINVYAFFRTTRNIREGGVESRLVKLSRQLLIAHIMVLFTYGVWRSYWFYNIVWVQGNLMCKIFSFFCALPFHLWSNLVAAIAVDMLCCITSPLNSYRTAANRVDWLIALAWICAILCALPMAFIRGTITIYSFEDESYEQCYPLVNSYSREVLVAFNFFHVITTFYVPLAIVVVCYSLIGLSLRKQMAERKLLQDGGKKKKQSSTKARFLRASLAVICTFFFTWLPYQVLALLRVVCDENAVCESITSRINWLQAIIIASTCINPFLYRFGVDRKRCSYNCSTMESGMGRASVREMERSPHSELLIKPSSSRRNSRVKNETV
ncbi:unnamed protein product [Cylicocyclus nassatus]|uniref:G-protein coupled receptors family 1 profile domain-containing protein n=1 Tax=Cylicocyclus nassatus TaxID=53992 RepID=A0AA36HFC8_CYLNA|nr:unnamed protein product [Cylicocyclus nassatus]